MKTCFPCILLLSASLSSDGQNHVTENGESARILALENLWNQAELKRDVRALELLLANTFVHTDSDGSFMYRTQWLAHVKRGHDHYEQLGNGGLVVQVYGDAAVVTGMYRERVKLVGKSVVRRGRQSSRTSSFAAESSSRRKDSHGSEMVLS